MRTGEESPAAGVERERQQRLDPAETQRRAESAAGRHAFFVVRRKTPSRWVSPWIHASAVIQAAERLMMSARPARRHEMVVQCRRVHVMQTVATMMSDIGSSGELPPSGISTKSEPVSSRAVTMSSRSVKAQHQQVAQPAEARHQVVAALARR